MARQRTAGNEELVAVVLMIVLSALLIGRSVDMDGGEGNRVAGAFSISDRAPLCEQFQEYTHCEDRTYYDYCSRGEQITVTEQGEFAVILCETGCVRGACR